MKKDILEKEKADSMAIDYVPKEFPLRVSGAASQFVGAQNLVSSDFQISELVAQQSGIAHEERKKLDSKVEAEALEKLKEIEEKAYKEAYELGIIEGTEKAFADNKEELSQKLNEFDQLLSTFENIKTELISKSEGQMIRLLNMMASKIALKEIKSDKEIIISVIHEVIEDAQTDEDITLHISFEDHMFIESLREKMAKKVDFLKKVKLEPTEGITNGGCLLETQFGAIDASLEERLERVWSALEEKVPKDKDIKSGAKSSQSESEPTESSDEKPEDEGDS